MEVKGGLENGKACTELKIVKLRACVGGRSRKIKLDLLLLLKGRRKLEHTSNRDDDEEYVDEKDENDMGVDFLKELYSLFTPQVDR